MMNLETSSKPILQRSTPGSSLFFVFLQKTRHQYGRSHHQENCDHRRRRFYVEDDDEALLLPSWTMMSLSSTKTSDSALDDSLCLGEDDDEYYAYKFREDNLDDNKEQKSDLRFQKNTRLSMLVLVLLAAICWTISTACLYRVEVMITKKVTNSASHNGPVLKGLASRAKRSNIPMNAPQETKNQSNMLAFIDIKHHRKMKPTAMSLHDLADSNVSFVPKLRRRLGLFEANEYTLDDQLEDDGLY